MCVGRAFNLLRKENTLHALITYINNIYKPEKIKKYIKMQGVYKVLH